MSLGLLRILFSVFDQNLLNLGLSSSEPCVTLAAEGSVSVGCPVSGRPRRSLLVRFSVSSVHCPHPTPLQQRELSPAKLTCPSSAVPPLLGPVRGLPPEFQPQPCPVGPLSQLALTTSLLSSALQNRDHRSQYLICTFIPVFLGPDSRQSLGRNSISKEFTVVGDTTHRSNQFCF